MPHRCRRRCCLRSGASSRTPRGATALSWSTGSSASGTLRRAPDAARIPPHQQAATAALALDACKTGCPGGVRCGVLCSRLAELKSEQTRLPAGLVAAAGASWHAPVPAPACTNWPLHARFPHRLQGRVTPAESGEYSFAKYNKKVRRWCLPARRPHPRAARTCCCAAPGLAGRGTTAGVQTPRASTANLWRCDPPQQVAPRARAK